MLGGIELQRSRFEGGGGGGGGGDGHLRGQPDFMPGVSLWLQTFNYFVMFGPILRSFLFF